MGVLNGPRDRVRQVLVARRLLLREHQRRLRLVHLCLVSGDLGLLHIDLRIDVRDTGVCSGHLRLRLGERRAVCAIVNARDHPAGVDMLIVGDRDSRGIARHLGGDRELARRNVGVLRILEVAGIVPVEVPDWQRRKQQ